MGQGPIDSSGNDWIEHMVQEELGKMSTQVQEELGKMSAKMDTLMKSLILMERRLSVVEDQVKLCIPQQTSAPNDSL